MELTTAPTWITDSCLYAGAEKRAMKGNRKFLPRATFFGKRSRGGKLLKGENRVSRGGLINVSRRFQGDIRGIDGGYEIISLFRASMG